jgi:methylenetetrahydrofolate--tRNA-(uracil-5-)-methyltransferase
MRPVKIIGGGLAGCEAAWQVAKRGIPVHLYEMRPDVMPPAHRTGELAELVCSNSLKSDRVDRASGLLKAELTLIGSMLLKAGRVASIPGGSSLCVDRSEFSNVVTSSIDRNPLITVIREEVSALPDEGPSIVATGPLSSEPITQAMENLFGTGSLAFYDAIAPTVESDSIDWNRVFVQDRYEEPGQGVYVNCPLQREQYLELVDALRTSETVKPHAFENTKLFEACLPVEVLAARGEDTLAFGPMRPVGLTDPKTGKRPYAVVQLRPENRARTLYGMVGFQTKMRMGEQERVLCTIPGLEHARFERLGSIHRNTFINSPVLLDSFQRSAAAPWLFFAGQITGVEGYVESIASGAMAGIYAAVSVLGMEPCPPPPTTMTGALLHHLTFVPHGEFQPINAQFGLLPLPDGPKTRKADRRRILSERAVTHMTEYLSKHPSGL